MSLGVSHCGGVLRVLLERKLIRVLGRREIAGRHHDHVGRVQQAGEQRDEQAVGERHQHRVERDDQDVQRGEIGVRPADVHHRGGEREPGSI